MKKLTLIVSLLLVALLALSGCGNDKQPASSQDATAQPTASASEGEEPASPPAEAPAEGLAGKTKLIMGTEAGFAPYEYYDDNNKVVGVDPDIAQVIAEALGLELEIQEMDFDAIIPEVQSGRIDFGAAGMTINEERSKQVDFSIPYATSKQIIVVKADNADITGPESLAGKSVGVQLGTVADYELTDSYADTTVERYKKYFEAISDLLNGRIDAIAMDVLPAQEFIAQNSELKILDQELMTDEYALAVQKGNTELLEAINTELQKMIDSGKIDEFTINHTVTEN